MGCVRRSHPAPLAEFTLGLAEGKTRGLATLPLQGRVKEKPMPTSRWPELPYAAWKDTAGTLQLWTQILGKVRLARRPGSTTPGR